jgi:hypothetical protein
VGHIHALLLDISRQVPVKANLTQPPAGYGGSSSNAGGGGGSSSSSSGGYQVLGLWQGAWASIQMAFNLMVQLYKMKEVCARLCRSR